MDGGAAAAEAFAKEQRIAARRERIAARVALQAGEYKKVPHTFLSSCVKKTVTLGLLSKSHHIAVTFPSCL